MTESEPKRTLMGFLAIGPVGQAIKRRLFGGWYFRYYNFLEVTTFLYQNGAILGRARRDRLTTLEKILARPKKEGEFEGEFIEYMQNKAKEHLARFKKEVGKDPDSFYQFHMLDKLAQTCLEMFPEIKKMGLSLTRVMCGDAGEQARLSERMDLRLFMKKMVKTADLRVPLKEGEPLIEWCGLEGVGFGSSFPELTEKMYRNAHENIDMDQWSEMRAHGVILPERPTIISLEEQEQAVLADVANYTMQYFPGLIAPPGFTDMVKPL